MKQTPGEIMQPVEFGQTQNSYDIFAIVSGNNTKESLEQAEAFFSKLPDLPNDIFQAALEIRKFLIQQGFTYDDNTFCLSDMLANKKGNCLGLSLLIGSELQRRGFNPEYQIILHPFDAIDKQDQRLFEELMRGDHFDYEKAPLAKKQAPSPLYRFAPLEHPSLILDGQRFETTGLDDLEEDPKWSPEAELIKPANFTEVASNVLVDRGKSMVKNDKIDNKKILALALEAIKLAPDNREAWAFVFDVANAVENTALKEQAKENYFRIGGNDSRFYNTCYKMTGDKKYLDLALGKFPAYLEPFVEKNVILEKDEREAKFNLAVASWCAANSSVFTLKWFYERYADEVVRLFGKETLEKLMKS